MTTAHATPDPALEMVDQLRELHMLPVRTVEGWMQWCADEEAEMFALYRVDDHQVGTSTWVADFQDKNDALLAMAVLEETARTSALTSAATHGCPLTCDRPG